ncbi:hypothetical protein A4H97_31865 [Niastella yeongjuensis]|uniref:DUF4394 domain-containing protein n=1 Tax=Niastella yeongjuensis TaxID=354355 RepID=A0A1V9EIR2_9BACT|nr:hypothetical protein [Niastella yeongjuensis]OQP46020.1 hypothetical protein A4H97_31865 [Niastella yeongjuensis]SEP18644.1 hypothetical protein SAMN05660816_04653 [Niastella yeongjuensis]
MSDSGSVLTRINVTTKQVTSFRLPSSETKGTSQLVVDKSNNVYGITYDWTSAMQTQTLVKIQPSTGVVTPIKSFVEDDDWVEPVYLPATNEIVGLMNDGRRLFKVNLTTKDTIGINLPGSASAEYRELIVDNNSNLFAYKARLKGDVSDVAKLVAVNAATGQETILKDLPVDGKFQDNIIIVPQLGGFVGSWNQSALYKIDVNSPFDLTSRSLGTGNGNTYNYFTTN